MPALSPPRATLRSALLLLLLASCSSENVQDAGGSQDTSTRDASAIDASRPDAADAGTRPPTFQCVTDCTFEIVATYPHDQTAFTQGLVVEGSRFYESTGLFGQSTLRHVQLEAGAVSRQIDLDPNQFAEGITVWNDTIVQLTWQAQMGYVYDKETLQQRSTFTYATEGWGITHDGTRLIMSDGTATISFLDPSTFAVTGTVEVRDQGQPITWINELEYIDGHLFANIWRSDSIVRIDPADGRVVGWIDLADLPSDAEPPANEHVLNGIAYDSTNDRLFVTGKRWPKLFEIRVVEK